MINHFLLNNTLIKFSIYRAIIFALFLFIFLLYSEKVMANPTEFNLDNGVTVIYKYVPNVKIVSVQSWIKTGSVNEDKLPRTDEAGTA